MIIIFGDKMLIKWKVDTLISCIDEEGNDWDEPMMAGESFEVDNVVPQYEDGENGDMVSIFMPDDVVATSNKDWFDIIEYPDS